MNNFLCNSCMHLQIFPNGSISSEAVQEAVQVMAVMSAEELQAAVAGAARHIELRSNVDLTSLHTIGEHLPGSVSAETNTPCCRYWPPSPRLCACTYRADSQLARATPSS